MSKTFRGFVILSLILFSYYLLHPSVMYYYFTDPKIQAVSEMDPSYRDLADFSEEELEALGQADEYRAKSLKLGLDLKGGLDIVIEADFEKLANLIGKNLSEITDEEKNDSMDRVMNRLRKRLDATGVSEVSLRKVGPYRINIQLPGETSSKRIENIVSTTGKLELRLVDDEITSSLSIDPETKEAENLEALSESGNLDGVDLLYLYERDELNRDVKSRLLAVSKQVMLQGDKITSATMRYGQYNEPNVAFQLNSKGATQFAQVTSTNVGRLLAIVLDDRVISAPRINVAITGGEATIEGSFGVEEAKDLSLILKSGSLPVPINVVTKDLIGAKIGADSKERGVRALFLGMLAVLIFMLLRYKFSGFIASFSLLLNALIIVAFLASLGLTISLPGLAGILLTVGMAIDANVIIYERIREEIKVDQKSLVDAIYQGYNRAFWAIFDSNMTTLIATFVLFYYGTGIIQGFATTLFVGIIASMFTSLFVTRFLFDFFIDYRLIRNKTRFIV